MLPIKIEYGIVYRGKNKSIIFIYALVNKVTGETKKITKDNYLKLITCQKLKSLEV